MLFFLLTIAVSECIHVLLPDTQYYSGWHPMVWKSQTDWICGCKDDLGIDFVSHLGDIVDDGNSDKMWHTAVNSLKCIRDIGINTSFVPGNHDYSNGNLERYLHYFLPILNNSYTHFMPDHPENNYQIIERVGMTFIILNLEYLPNTQVMAWADSILKNNTNKLAIVISHAILSDCSIYIYQPFRTLIYDNCNVFLSLNGHFGFCGGEAKTIYNNSCGQPSFFLVQDYQQRSRGGDGFLRYLDFRKEDTLKVCAYTYTTLYDRYELDSNSYFSFKIGNFSFQDGCQIEKKCFRSEMKFIAPLITAYFFCFCFIIFLAQIYYDI